jgi:hypothetical protein
VPRGRRLALLSAAVVVYGLCVSFSEGGLNDGRPWGNGDPYYYSLNILDGKLPYRDFSLEYPPLALPIFLLPHLFAGDGLLSYLGAFRAVMAVLGLACLLLAAYVLVRTGADDRRFGLALGAIAVAPALLGHVFLNRYDLWPTVLFMIGLAALVARREGLAAGSLAASFAAKIFPLVVAPIVLLRIHRRLRAVAIAVAVVVACFGPFVVLAPHGLGASFKVQLGRHLETESLGASLLLALDRLGIYDAHVISGNPGSIDLSGTVPGVLGVLTSVLLAVAVVAVAVLYARCPRESDPALVLAFATAVASFVVFAKVISPQYLDWLIPLVPLVAGRAGVRASVLLLAALPLSQALSYGFSGTRIEAWTVWVLFARNVLLAGMLAALFLGMKAAARAPSATIAPPT